MHSHTYIHPYIIYTHVCIRTKTDTPTKKTNNETAIILKGLSNDRRADRLFGETPHGWLQNDESVSTEADDHPSAILLLFFKRRRKKKKKKLLFKVTTKPHKYQPN